MQVRGSARSNVDQDAEADRVASHSFSVFGPFETLQGRQAVARLGKALEPPRLKGTI
jgi:hypothetical protein